MIQKRKILLLVTCFMMIGLIASLIGGCAGGEGEGEGEGGGDQPQYGGVLNILATSDPTGWDDAVGGNAHYSTSGCYQCLWSGDWTKGNAGGYGTKQSDWILPGPINRLNGKTGYIAQSWEIGSNYIIFHLRDGVKWENRTPTKGRAVTADDVVVSINRNTQTGAYLKTAYADLAASMIASKVDDRTVRVECAEAQMSTLISMIDFMYIYPADVLESFGNMNDWERAIGTGPFTVKKYVVGSEVDLERRDDYWETNPIGPGQGDQLPYLDGVRVLIQPDAATQDSLFTTGKLDIIGVEYDRAQILKTLTGVKYVKYQSDAAKAVICFKVTNPDKPYNDLRVRQALTLAIDHQKIVTELYGGEAQMLYWPLADTKEYHDAFLALNDYPTTVDPRVGEYGLSVKDLYTYNPTKAKQLLADAGYPDGFQCTIIVWNYYFYLDQLEVVKDMWADIGVDMTISTVDYATVTRTMYFHTYDDLLYSGLAGAGTYFKGTNWDGNGLFNGSLIDDPVLKDYKAQMMAAFVTNEDEAMSIHQEMLPYIQEQCYVIQVVSPDTYRFWWPWVKNYSGEGSLGYYKYINNGFGGLTQYIWIDQALKESMGFGD